jgi:hypothetical protein
VIEMHGSQSVHTTHAMGIGCDPNGSPGYHGCSDPYLYAAHPSPDATERAAKIDQSSRGAGTFI